MACRDNANAHAGRVKLMPRREGRTELIQVRLTPEERELLEAAVAAQASARERTISWFIRSTALARARETVDGRRRNRVSRVRIIHGGEVDRK